MTWRHTLVVMTTIMLCPSINNCSSPGKGGHLEVRSRLEPSHRMTLSGIKREKRIVSMTGRGRDGDSSNGEFVSFFVFSYLKKKFNGSNLSCAQLSQLSWDGSAFQSENLDLSSLASLESVLG